MKRSRLIADKAYVGTGLVNDTSFKIDFWEYTPDSACITGIEEDFSTFIFQFSINPNPFTTTTTLQIPPELLKENCSITILDATGKKVFQTVITKTQLEISRRGIADGIYFYQVFSKEKAIGSGKMVAE